MNEHIGKVARHSMMIYILLILTAFSGYAIRVTLARNLSVYEYGLFYSLFTLFGFLSIFVDFGLTQGTINEIVKLRVNNKYEDIKNITLSILIIQLMLALLIVSGLLAASDLLSKYYYKADVSYILLPLSLYFLTIPLALFFINIIYGFGKTYYQTGLEFMKNIFVLFLIFVGLFVFNLKIEAPAYGYAIANIIAFIILIPIFTKTFPHFFKLKFKFDSMNVFKTIKYGIYVTLATMGWLIITQTDTLMLTYYSSLENVGIYNVAVTVSMTLLYFAHAISAAIYPTFSEFKTREDTSNLSDMTSMIYSYIQIVVLPIAIIFFFYPEIIISILFGPFYAVGAMVLKIFAVAMPLISIGIINYNILAAIGRAQESFKIMLSGAMLNIFLNFLLMPQYGILGAAIASVLSYIIIMFFSTYKLRKIYGFTIQYLKLLKILLCSIIFFGSISLLKKYLELSVFTEIFVVMTISILLYLVSLFVFRVITKKVITKLYKLVVHN